jgi:uncharacterized membrane protein
MGTFLESLHIFAALLVIGPLLWAPITARRAIGRREAAGVRAEARKLVRFGAGSVVVAVLGALTLLAYRSYNFASPWVVISITLYVVTLGVLYFLTVPAMRKAARLVDAGGPPSQANTGGGAKPSAPGNRGDDLLAKERLGAVSGRVSVASVLLLLLFAAITVLIVARPFGA